MSRKKIRILFNVLCDETDTNAQSLNARDITLRLDPERFESTMFVTGQPDPRLVNKTTIHLIKLPPRLGSLIFSSHLIWGNYDIVFYPPPVRVLKLWQAFAWMGRGKKFVTPLEGPIGFLDHKYITFALRKILLKSDLAVAVSEYVSREIENVTGFKTDIIIPVGVDTHFFVPAPQEKSRIPQILFIGRLIKRKGHELVVEAAKIFSDVQFRLVGATCSKEDVDFAIQLKNTVLKEGLTNIEFTGKVKQAELRQLLWESDILLHPSRIESISKVALEAAATGLPCIVFADYNTPAVVDGVTGFQVKTFDEMVDRLRQLIGDQVLRSRMGSAAVQHVKQFDWSLITRQWEQVFLDMVSNKT